MYKYRVDQYNILNLYSISVNKILLTEFMIGEVSQNLHSMLSKAIECSEISNVTL